MKENISQDQPEVATDQERRRLFLRYVNRGWLIFGVVTLMAVPFFPEERGVFVYLIVVIFPTYLITRLLNRSGRTRLAGVVFTVSVNFGFYGLFLMLVRDLGADEAFRSQATVWMLLGLAVLFAGAFVDKWAAPVVAVVDTVLLIVTRLTLAPAADPRPAAAVFWWMMALTIWLYERTLQQALERAWDEVAARKRADEQLRKLSSAVEHSPASITITDPAGTIEYVNPRFTANTGYTLEEVVGQSLRLLKSGLTQLDEYTRLWDTIEAGEEWRGEICNRKKNGELYWESASISPITDETGHLTHFVAVNEDITDRKRAEKALQESEKRYRLLAENVTDVIWTMDMHLRSTYTSPSVKHMRGYDAEEAMAQSLEEALTPASFEVISKALEEEQAKETWSEKDPFRSRTLEVEVIRKDGSTVWVETTMTFLRDSDGKPVEILGVNRDITERKRAEETLRLQSAALEAAANGIVITDRDGIIQWANPAFTTLTGFTLAEAVGRNPRDLIRSGKQDRAFYKHLWDTVLAGQVWRGELINRRKDGMLYNEEMTLTPLQDERGEVMHFIAIKQDVGERKRRERELEAIAGMATALRAAPTRATMLPVIVHQAFRSLGAVGAALATPTPALGENIFAYGQGDWVNWTGLRIPSGSGISGRVMATGHPFVTDSGSNDPRITRKDLVGDLPAVACVPLIAQDAVIGALWVGRLSAFTDVELRLLTAISDIAANALQRAQIVETLEQRVAERTHELAQANERLAELDRLKSKFVSDVSHELRTPVAILKLHIGLLEHGKPEKRDHYLQVIHEQADRQAQLVEDILNLSRLELGADKVQFAPVALNPLIEQIIAAHQPSADASGVTLTFTPDPDLPPVWGEHNQIAQVITNLIANALHYTPFGQVQVRTRLNDHRACLEVRDTGMGIDPEDLPHVFDRFYRGKHASTIRGTGLGLAIVKEIVDLHGGHIDVESQVGAGAIFRVCLPIAGLPAAAQ